MEIQGQNTTISTDMIMAEFIADVEKRHLQMTDYKNEVGTGIPMSESSARYQNYIREIISRQISELTGIPSEMAFRQFDSFMNDAVITEHLATANSPESSQYFNLKKSIKNETDKTKKALLKQQLIALKDEVSSKISPEEKTKLTDKFIENQIIPKHANLKMKTEINSPDAGYCLKAITESLHKISGNYGCNGFLPANTTENGEPQQFLQNLATNEKNAKHIFKSTPTQTFKQMAEQYNIQPGAIVILHNSKGELHHAMFWNGKKDENQEPLLMGFNSMGKEEENNVNASYAKNGNIRQMTVIDVNGLITEELRNTQQHQNQEMTNTLNHNSIHASFSNSHNQQAAEKNAVEKQKILTPQEIKIMKIKALSGKGA